MFWVVLVDGEGKWNVARRISEGLVDMKELLKEVSHHTLPDWDKSFSLINELQRQLNVSDMS
jgi:hypothetical protein